MQTAAGSDRDLRIFGNQIRTELFASVYTKLTKTYGFSSKRVKRALLECVDELDPLDAGAIRAIFEEE